MTESSAHHGPALSSGFEDQFHRVFAAAACRTQVELADFLDIRQSSIADAKRRKSIPSGWLIKLYRKKRVNPEWVRTGRGIMLLGADNGALPLDWSREAPPLTQGKGADNALAGYSTDELLAEVLHRAMKAVP